MDLEGKRVQGYVEASNKYEAFNTVREQSLYPFKIKKAIFTLDKTTSNSIGKVPMKYIIIFCQQMYVIMRSGIPILQALQSIYTNTKNRRLKKILGDVYVDIQKGVSLSRSFQIHKEKLPNMFVEMIQAGEASGNLELSFKYMSEHYEREYILKKRFMNALVYPAFVLVLTVVLVQFIVSYVTPHFTSIYVHNDESLPAATKALLSISEKLGGGRFILGLTIIFIISFVIIKNGSSKVHNFVLKLPIIGSMIIKIITTRVCIVMSMLLKSGISIVDSLDMTCNIVSNKAIKSELRNIEEKINEGRDIVYSFSSSKIFPLIFKQLLSAGAISGSIEDAFDGVAKFYESEIKGKMERYLVLLEPMLILIVGVIVGFISYALILPIYKLVDIL